MELSDIEHAFTGTCQCKNGYFLNDCLANVRGERANTVYSLLQLLSDASSFNAILVHSDGGVQEVFVVYQFGEFMIIVKALSHMYTLDWPFDSAETMCDWLNRMEKRIKATAVLMTT